MWERVTSEGCVIDSRRALLFFFCNKHSRTHEKIRHFADSYKSWKKKKMWFTYMRSSTLPKMRCIGIWWQILLRSSTGLVGPSISLYIAYYTELAEYSSEVGSVSGESYSRFLVLEYTQEWKFSFVGFDKQHSSVPIWRSHFSAYTCYYGEKKRQTIKVSTTRGSHFRVLPFFNDLYASSRLGHIFWRREEFKTSRERRLSRWWPPSTEIIGSTMINLENLTIGWICCNISLDEW